jgi:hypothetical protein
VTGVAPGLQNQCWADKVLGGFDSHSPPPFWFYEVELMSVFNKTVLALLMISGAACVVYGTCFHSVNMWSDSNDMPVAQTRSELALTQEASVGGVDLDKATGQIKQTYTGQSPEACAT